MVYVLNLMNKWPKWYSKMGVRKQDNITFIDAYSKNQKINFRKVKKICGEHPVVMPKSITPSHGVKLYDSENFELTIMFNSVKKILSLTGNKSNITLCFSDPYAKGISFLKPLLNLAGTIYVTTMFPQKYENLSQQLERDLGVSLLITNEPNSNIKFDFLYMPYKQDENFGPALYIKDIFSKYIFTSSCFVVDDFLKYNLKDICHCQLAMALYEDDKESFDIPLVSNTLISNGSKVKIC